MRRSINRIVLVGNVGRDPDVSTTSAGSKVAHVSLATSRRVPGNGRAADERTDWHRLTLWGPLAQFAEEYVRKGQGFYVEGHLEYGSFERDGVTIPTAEVVDGRVDRGSAIRRVVSHRPRRALEQLHGIGPRKTDPRVLVLDREFGEVVAVQPVAVPVARERDLAAQQRTPVVVGRAVLLRGHRSPLVGLRVRPTDEHHIACEAYLEDRPLPDGLTEEEFDCAVAVEAFLRQHVAKVLAVELTVFSITHEYAGTLDLWALGRDGHTYILDWKTSASVYVDHAVQLAAYANAEYAVANKRPTGQADKEAWDGTLTRWGPEKAERLGIVHVRPDGVTLHPVNYTSRLWQVFRAAAFMKLWQLDTDNYKRTPRERVFGDPIEVQLQPSQASTAAA